MTKFWRFFLLLACFVPARADWPALHGNPQHDGFIAANVTPPFRLAWARHFPGERLGTAMEPIVAEGKVFIATHNGGLHALDAVTGEQAWSQAKAGFLQSPAYAEGRLVTADIQGTLAAVDAQSGKSLWNISTDTSGFCASPLISGKTIFIGSRSGEFFAVALDTGKILWKQTFPAPIQQTAAYADGRVFVAPEDLRLRCLDAATGKILWTSEPLPGQTARDYYPIVVKIGGRTLVIVRTNPLMNMGQRIGRDRTFLCRQAGVDDSDWKKLDTYIKSDAAHGTPELWSKEQAAVTQYLKEHRDAQSFFVIDVETGKEANTAPVLWIAGCQGVGAQPALTADGLLLVFYRSVYGNWNHGVAPLVTLGLLDPVQNHITPLFHASGKQPPWNTFWGTADESQNFVVAGQTVLVVHQGTLSGFDLKTSKLFPIWGERDTYGKFRSPAWARNEWHGPGRGGVAVVSNRIYWSTGSRVLCISMGEVGRGVPPSRAEDTPIVSAGLPKEPDFGGMPLAKVRLQLNETAGEILSKNWAPLFVDPGLSGRDFSFDDSGELFEALAWAYPYLDSENKAKAKARLEEEWKFHLPFTKQGWYKLDDGNRREYFWTYLELYARLGGDRQPHPFANTYSAWLYSQRCDEWKRVQQAWPEVKAAFEDFLKSNWRLDSAKGDLYANRYLASLLALDRMASVVGDAETANRARAMADSTTEALIAWWQRAGSSGTLTNFNGTGQLDPFIGNGDAISFRVAPHRHKIALFQGLTRLGGFEGVWSCKCL